MRRRWRGRGDSPALLLALLFPRLLEPDHELEGAATHGDELGRGLAREPARGGSFDRTGGNAG
jgi:hypothetical protein